MRKIVVDLVLAVLATAGWVGVASWQWSHKDLAALFRARIDAEAPSGKKVAFSPGSIVSGDLGGGATLVCGTGSRLDAAGGRSEMSYSLIAIKTLFDHRINDPCTIKDAACLASENSGLKPTTILLFVCWIGAMPKRIEPYVC